MHLTPTDKKHKLRALIIGVDSNIGEALRAYLAARGFEVYGTTRRKCASSKDVLFFDLNDLTTLTNIHGIFDVVYMCAALTNQQFCDDNVEMSEKINVTAQTAVADYCAKLTDNIVFLSSNAVFDGSTPFVKSGSATSPKNVYGLHKDLIEKYLLQSSNNVTIVRTSKVITPAPKLLLDWIQHLKAGKCIEPFYDMTLCPVALDSLLKLLELIAINPARGILQISGNQDILYSELALTVVKRLNVSENLIKAKSYVDVGISPKIVYKYSSLDMTETTRIYNIKPSTINDILELMSFN